jgi:spore germination protein YaaH
VHALAAALLALGPHAAEARAHARDPAAAWISAAIPAARPTSTTALPKRVYGYLPYWENIDLQSFRWDLVSDVIAFSVEIAPDGTVSNPYGLPGAALLSAAHAQGVRVHLCATLFNTSGGSEIATFLADAAPRASAAAQLAALAPDGVNLDFEFVPSASRDAFTAFVQQLRAALPAAVELTLAMPATTSYSGYDFAALAATSDRLLLMEYDFHWRTGPSAGAVAPLPDVQRAVDGYLGRVSASSLAMGVPYYGYEWPTSSGSATSGAGSSVLFESVFAKFSSWGRLWDSEAQTPWYSIPGAQPRQGWVDDGESLSLKLQLARSRDLAGVMIWALGYDGARTEAWAALQSYQSGSPAALAPAAQGCSHAGNAPLWTLLAAVAVLSRRRTRTLPRAA